MTTSADSDSGSDSGSDTTWPDWLSSTLAADATGGIGALGSKVRALTSGQRIVGRAWVVGLGRDDNSPMRDVTAIDAAPGDVLVVGGAADSRTAILGDLVARELLNVGITAVVTDGMIRDAETVAEVGLRVWARGTTSVASRKDGVGYVGNAVPIAGAVAQDGDLVIADSDGVVVWPQLRVDELLAKADAKRQADEERLSRLA